MLAKLAAERGPGLDHQLDEDRFLALEVLIQRRPRRLGAVGDVVDGRGVVRPSSVKHRSAASTICMRVRAPRDPTDGLLGP